MFALKRLMPAASLVTMLTLAACSDSVGPENVDPEVLQSGATSAMNAFLNNAAFQSVALVSDSTFPQFAAVQLVRGTLPRIAGAGRAELHASALRMSRVAASLNHPDALFPANVLGKTMEWNPSTKQYEIGTAPGAPANGMRLTLYFGNPNTGFPFIPLQTLGYLELTDKSTPQSDKLGVLLTLAQTTIASYDITIVSGTNTASAQAKGYMKSGTGVEQTTFDLNDAINVQAQTLTSTNDLTGPDGTTIHVQMTIGQTSDNLTARVTRGNAALELTAAGNILGNTGPVSGAVKFNGTTVATLTGTIDDPTITGAGGRTFTAEQTLSLLTIFAHAIDIVFYVSDGVFAPGTIVFN